MKVYKQVEVQAHTENKQVGVACDICGKQSGGGTFNWSPNHWEVASTDVAYRLFSDGEPLDSQSRDICPDCFMDKLIPFIDANGTKPT